MDEERKTTNNSLDDYLADDFAKQEDSSSGYTRYPAAPQDITAEVTMESHTESGLTAESSEPQELTPPAISSSSGNQDYLRRTENGWELNPNYQPERRPDPQPQVSSHSEARAYAQARMEAPQDEPAYAQTYGLGDDYNQQESYSQSQSYSGQQTQQQPHAARPAGKKREPRYVTKGALAICLVLTMLVSSLLGGFLGAKYFGKTGYNGTPAREDSQLTSLELADGTGDSMTVGDVIKMNQDAVVEILVSGTTQDFFGMSQITQGAGSGVIINKDGYIVTNYHVIEGANKVQVTLHNGDTYSASIVGGVDDLDIAVIKIDPQGKELSVASIGDSSTVQVGDTAVAIGNPLGQLGGTATAGIISALDRNLTIDDRTLTLMQTDAAINGGNSGGGLFNAKGELIGIVDAKSSGVGIEGLAFAIPINSVSETINDLVERGENGESGISEAKPAVGITITEVSKENAEYYNLESEGVYIADVTGENARKAGFQQGDRIISFNGDEINGSEDFIGKVRKCNVGDTVTIVVSRDGQKIEIKTVLEEMITNN